ncbi:hypothetical protein NJF44_03545 [Pseudomonas guariconensis]|uniref:hypothetical protein n=1 Tax=Pseudomonas TaxID=286 RepID=UPI0020983157|nr:MULTISPECIES: hypothetical protein [Pseudomonas]MCO7637571.1 hypothetical protein [Pseudomonas sp. S 311-6]MCO7515232.1 hypothetical protein [Pseudomonas putida]MCO7565018.1 hypothetical protein [Pseudomonas mosselii]MCO7604308.1 hypothetical protein [Pseudomonas guariconensis]MCO7616532.1 hypothetical protein [Pseudomonas guariconensis]
MNLLLEKNREKLTELLASAQQRLDTLKETVQGANGDSAGSDIRIAIDDAITPLRIAFEVAEPI